MARMADRLMKMAVMSQEIQWLIGVSVALLVAIGTIAITAFRAVGARIEGVIKEMRQAVADGDRELHDRVSRLRQDVSDNYVRRVDLDSHMKRLDDNHKELRADLKEALKQLAKLIP